MVNRDVDFYLCKSFPDEREQQFIRSVKEKFGFVILDSCYEKRGGDTWMLTVWIDSEQIPPAFEEATRKILKVYQAHNTDRYLGETANEILQLYFSAFQISPFDQDKLSIQMFGWKEEHLRYAYGQSIGLIGERITRRYPEIPADCIMDGYDSSVLILTVDAEMTEFLEKRRENLEKICYGELKKRDYANLIAPDQVSLKIVNRQTLDRDTLNSVLMIRMGNNPSL